MARMGHWTKDPGEEIELDGIGGVNIMVKSEVHRSGEFSFGCCNAASWTDQMNKASTFPATHLRIKPRQKALQRWQKEQATESLVCLITLFGI